MSGLLDDRRRGVEEAFFAKQNEQLRLKLRAADGGATSRSDLAAASGLQNTRVLDDLADLKIGTEGAAALALTPLIAVAWADGEVSEKEREALLSAAKQSGLKDSDPGYHLFAGWLDDTPPTTLMERWKDYAQALLTSMPAESRTAFRQEVMKRAHAVATSAGGFLGFGSVSDAEKAVLQDIEATLGG